LPAAGHSTATRSAFSKNKLFLTASNLPSSE
jgi:hypothetical protein